VDAVQRRHCGGHGLLRGDVIAQSALDSDSGRRFARLGEFDDVGVDGPQIEIVERRGLGIAFGGDYGKTPR
jgi:hypothetical protein